jgi:outer membrane murein-binding lipoprotein Lpp
MKITIDVHHYHHTANDISPRLARLAREVRDLARHNDELIPDVAGSRRGDRSSNHQCEESSMSATEAQVIAALNDAKASLQKTASEIPTLQAKVDELTAKVDQLQNIIDAGGTISAELVSVANDVKALAAQVDDLIPDAPVVPTDPPADPVV